MKKYMFVRVTPDTHKKLKILAATSGESLITMMEILTEEATKSGKKKHY